MPCFLGGKGVKEVRVIYSTINVRPCATFCANGSKVILPAHQKKQISLSRLLKSVQADYHFISARKCLGEQFLYDAGDNAAVGLAGHLL